MNTNNNNKKYAWGQALLNMGIVLSCFAFLYADGLSSLWYEWVTSGSVYSHGPLVLAVSLYLMWLKKNELFSFLPSRAVIPLVLLVAAAPLWGVAVLLSIETLKHLIVCGVAYLLVWALWGRKSALVLFLPFAYLIFSIPIWNVLTPILQTISANAAGAIVSMLGISILIDGYFLVIPEGVFEVESGCSGVNYLLAGLALATFFAYLNYQSWKKKVLFVLGAFVLTVVGNSIRIAIIVTVGHETDMQHSLMHDHIGLGWAVFVVMMMPLYWLGYKYIDPDVVVDDAQSMPPSITGASAVGIFTALPALFALAAGPGVVWASQHYLAHSIDGAKEQLVANVAGSAWKPSGKAWGQWQPDFLGADFELKQVYQSARQGDAYAYIAYYAEQGRHKNLTFGDNSLSGSGWSVKESGEIEQDSLVVKESLLVEKSSGAELLVWSWYSVGDQTAVSRLKAKLLELDKLKGGVSKGSAMVALAVPLQRKGIDSARNYLQEFYQAQGVYLQHQVQMLGAQK